MKQPVAIALAVVSLGVLGTGVWLATRGGADLPDSAPFVDVTTGEIRSLPLNSGRTLVIPAPDEKGERVLFPLVKDDQGEWVVDPHYQQAFLTRFAGRPNLCVDEQTFRVIQGQTK